MKKGSIRRFVVVSLFGLACTALNTGCTFVENIAYGFALALGAIPAETITGLITDSLIPPE